MRPSTSGKDLPGDYSSLSVKFSYWPDMIDINKNQFSGIGYANGHGCRINGQPYSS